jgi:hypothetical protein
VVVEILDHILDLIKGVGAAVDNLYHQVDKDLYKKNYQYLNHSSSTKPKKKLTSSIVSV